ncbi:HTH-type transcriptional regulator MhqR [Rubripirellula lacrimiformis]|uniref:HTH-type transcriptional regulator MhqR n=1 Tax=Rubripirellula lacrimiformis TaxID=1930273 RepID=A0A517NC30_9BACT|nr:MarR family transcriptional regulator [Rubripirellula lacrimiformis]QDT04696.1 HTH-type transcriptional regulator MhqR [Rubripirellula lacrimiformis]
MKLQEELKRPQPFATLQQETLLNLLRISDQLENRIARLFREYGLTLSRFNVLRNLDMAERPLTCGEIGERMIQIVPAITSLVDQLEKHELVQRTRCTEDRRVVYVAITKKGSRLAEQIMIPLLELEARLFKKMSRTEIKSLLPLLEKTRASIAESETETKK